MSWIKDVREELSGLDRSPRSRRNFALVMLLIPGLIYLGIYRNTPPEGFYWWLPLIWLALFVPGLLFPPLLRPLHTAWMALAFALGWLVSRLLLTLIWFILLTPIGFIARLRGKAFLDTRHGQGERTAWVRREKTGTDYTRMS